VFTGKFRTTSGKFTAFFLVILGVFGKVYDGIGKVLGFFGHIRCYRESFRRDRESLRVILGVFGKV